MGVRDAHVLSHARLCDPMDYSLAARLLCPWNFTGKNTGAAIPILEDLSDPGIEPTSSMSPALAGGFFTTSTTWEAQGISKVSIKQE